MNRRDADSSIDHHTAAQDRDAMPLDSGGMTSRFDTYGKIRLSWINSFSIRTLRIWSSRPATSRSYSKTAMRPSWRRCWQAFLSTWSLRPSVSRGNGFGRSATPQHHYVSADRCPECGGSGIDPSGGFTETGGLSYSCESCNGTGSASDSRGVHVPEGAGRPAAPGEGLPRASSAARPHKLGEESTVGSMSSPGSSAATLREKLWRALGEASFRTTDDETPYLDRLLAKLAEHGLEVRETK